MITNPVHSSPVTQDEALTNATPKQNPATQPSSVPQDKVTLSPQAQARTQQPISADKDHDGDSK